MNPKKHMNMNLHFRIRRNRDQRSFPGALLGRLLTIAMLGIALRSSGFAADMALYTDSYQNGWQNWSWGTTITPDTAVVHDGTTSLKIVIKNDGQWGALYLAHVAMDSTPYNELSFWINGGTTGGQKLNVLGVRSGQPLGNSAVALDPLTANAWKQITVSLADLGVANASDLDGFYIEDGLGQPQPAFYVDQITLTEGSTPPPPPPPTDGIALYTDSFQNGWQNWSWGTTITPDTTVVHDGTTSLKIVIKNDGQWGALYLAHIVMDSTPYRELTFWIHGGTTGGQKLNVLGVRSGQPLGNSAVALDPLTANSWKQITIPLVNLGVAKASDLDGFYIEDGLGQPQPAFYVDQISLTADSTPPPPPPTDSVALYTDSFQNAWQNWSWGTTITPDTGVVHDGTTSLKIVIKNDGQWGALYLSHVAMDSTPYKELTFWVHGGSTGGQKLNVIGVLGGQAQGSSAVPLGPLAANTWKLVTVPLTTLGVADASNLDGFYIEDALGQPQPAFYVDEIRLTQKVVNPPPPTTVIITVDPGKNHSISPWIYGINSYEGITDAPRNLTVNRAGGNRWTAYNWENNASNAGSDWFYSSDDYLGGGNVPAEAVRSLIAGDRQRGNASLITLQLQGYVSADKAGSVDLNDPNHIAKRFKQVVFQKGTPFTMTPSTTDPYVYMDEFAWALKQKFGTDIYADPKTPTFISLDNEPELWPSTHAEIQNAAPDVTTYIQNTIKLSKALKAVSPAVQIFGPVHYGFNGIVDFQGASGFNANYWFTDKYLADMKAASDTAGQRLLDVYDLHWYSEAQGDGTRITSLSGKNLTPTQIQAIVQSPRSLWDKTYSEDSWVAGYLNGPVQLLNRIQGKIDAIYPGTKIAITEYENGGDNHIAGAIAQADNLGIFGSKGVFMASFWPPNGTYSFTLAAFKMYRDYDGNLGTFGDTSLSAVSSDTARVVAYVSRDSKRPNRYVIVALNRSAAEQKITFAGLSIAGQAKIYRVEGTQPAPFLVGESSVNLDSWELTLPPLSVSTIEILTPEVGVTYDQWKTASFFHC